MTYDSEKLRFYSNLQIQSKMNLFGFYDFFTYFSTLEPSKYYKKLLNIALNVLKRLGSQLSFQKIFICPQDTNKYQNI